MVSEHALVMHSLIGWESRIGAWSRLENTSILGHDVEVAKEVCLNGAIVLPHKSVSQSIYAPKTIVM